jgi:hypothetical protein
MATQVELHRETDNWRRIAAGAFVTAGILILTSAAFPVPDDPADHARFVTLLVANAERATAFFTTKDVGQGTGLGLDIARRIVAERHSGAISIDPGPGGTVLQVRLPVRRSDTEAHQS